MTSKACLVSETFTALGLRVLERGWLSSNCVLLTSTHHTAMVDSGYHTHARQTTQWVLEQLGDRRLDDLINTHLHSDHCGGNSVLQARFPNVRTRVPQSSEIAVRRWDARLLTYEATGQDCPLFSLSDTLADGQTVSLADSNWEVLSAKGHDPDSIILFQPEARVLISADALWENGFGVVFPELDGENAFADVGQTLDLIESLRPRIIIPGHGAVFTDTVGALSRARARLEFFQQSPNKHHRHAMKVLIKFKLLEWQTIAFVNLMQWCKSTPHVCRQMPREEQAAAEWLEALLAELERSNALRKHNGLICNC